METKRDKKEEQVRFVAQLDGTLYPTLDEYQMRALRKAAEITFQMSRGSGAYVGDAKTALAGLVPLVEGTSEKLSAMVIDEVRGYENESREDVDETVERYEPIDATAAEKDESQ